MDVTGEILRLDTELMELSFRLGQPYLYKHAVGGCEHHIVFSDVRLPHADDDSDLANYPRVISDCSKHYPMCLCCKVNKSRLENQLQN